jgi:hypothetical protein
MSDKASKLSWLYLITGILADVMITKRRKMLGKTGERDI